MWKITKLKTEHMLTSNMRERKWWKPQCQLHLVTQVLRQTWIWLASYHLLCCSSSEKWWHVHCSGHTNFLWMANWNFLWMANWLDSLFHIMALSFVFDARVHQVFAHWQCCTFTFGSALSADFLLLRLISGASCPEAPCSLEMTVSPILTYFRLPKENIW